MLLFLGAFLGQKSHRRLKKLASNWSFKKCFIKLYLYVSWGFRTAFGDPITCDFDHLVKNMAQAMLQGLVPEILPKGPWSSRIDQIQKPQSELVSFPRIQAKHRTDEPALNFSATANTPFSRYHTRRKAMDQRNCPLYEAMRIPWVFNISPH